MNKNKFLLGIFMAVLVAVCSAFCGNISVVYATEAAELEVVEEFYPGTFEGEGTYVAGDDVILNANPSWDCDFLYWMEVDTEGKQLGTALSKDLEYTFVADRNITIKAKWARVGEFTGDSWYEEGTEATLNARMYPGYEFSSWVEVDSTGVIVDTLSTQSENYKFTVDRDMYVRATWTRNKYNVIFDNTKDDFAYSSANNSQTFGENYYDEQLSISIAVNTTKSDLYINELSLTNIKINGVTIADIIAAENSMNIICSVDNERKEGGKKIGFNELEIILNIRENINIEIDYQYLYKLEVKSGNHININDLKLLETDDAGNPVETHFVQVLNNKGAGNSSVYYEQISDYVYLVEDGQGITAIVSNGNDIYNLIGVHFDGIMQGADGFDETKIQSGNENNAYSKTIENHTTLLIYYKEVDYKITFTSYIKNLSNEFYDTLNAGLYNITDVTRLAGEGITFTYNAEDKQINISYNTKTYTWDNAGFYIETLIPHTIECDYGEFFGYEFVGFKVGTDMIVADSVNSDVSTYSYNLSAENPKDAEIQILFKYIEYTYQIRLVDDFFEDGVEYRYVSYLDGDATPANKVVVGAQLLLQANTIEYAIKGWSEVANPGNDDYKIPLEGATDTHSEYSFIFTPTSDDNSLEYVMYLDVVYRYLEEVVFNLNSTNIEHNVNYDKVTIDMENGIITFTNGNYLSESKGEESYTFAFVVNQDQINAIAADDTTFELNIYSSYDSTNGYVSSFGVTETIVDPTTGQAIDVYTELFKDVVIKDLPINNRTITISEGLQNEPVDEYTQSSPVLQYTEEDKTYTSVQVSGDFAITRVTTHVVGGSSTVEYSVGGESEYGFDKYKYYGELQAGVVEYLTFEELEDPVNGPQAVVTAMGTLFSDDNPTGAADQTICKSTTKMTYNTTDGRYEFKFNNHTAYLYKADGESGDYKYIMMSNTTYYYNSIQSRFELNRSTTPAPITGQVTRYDTYSIRIGNLLSDHLIMYLTKSSNPLLYEISIITNQAGSSMRWFDYVESNDKTYHTCMISSTYTSAMTATYFKLEQNIRIEINKSQAYSYENISITITGDDGQSDNREWNAKNQTISAFENDTIVIKIAVENIGQGYQFYGISFLEEEQTTVLDGNVYIHTFTMSDKYQDEIIYINFTVIEYTVNVNYYDQDGYHPDADYTGVNGELRIGDDATRTTSYSVNIENIYVFTSMADTGYYTSNAFFKLGENDELYINSLRGNNESNNTTTKWTLNASNFVNAIINNADENKIAQLHIYYSIHTYGVKINFKIQGNETIVRYPTLFINGNTDNPINVGNNTTYIDRPDLFVYGDSVEFVLDEIMVGTNIVNWQKGSQTVSRTNVYKVDNITSNINVVVNMEYIKYYLEFVYTDTNGTSQPWGAATIEGTGSDNSFVWKQKIQNNVFPNDGYVLVGQYFKDSNSQQQEFTEHYRTFDPANFFIETKAGKPVFKIYIVFDLKTINLSFAEVTTGFINGFEDAWSNSVISKKRNDVVEPLTDDYQFRTGDTLIMDISTAYAGITLSEFIIGGEAPNGNGGIHLNTENHKNYNVIVNPITQNTTTRNYNLQLEFTPEFIKDIQNDTTLFTCLRLKTYNLRFTYNYIAYKFQLPLNISMPDNAGGTSGQDKVLSMNGVVYGDSGYIFSVANANQINFYTNFQVTGFDMPGGRYITDRSEFELNWTNVEGEVNYWEQVALADYIEGDVGDILITLMIEPNVTLHGQDEVLSKVDSGIYVFVTQYNACAQGLSVLGDVGVEQPNVSIGNKKGGDSLAPFEILIKYYYGDSEDPSTPINTGTYRVHIWVKLGNNTNQEPVKCDKEVSLIINPKMLTIETSHNRTNPVVKPYDKTNSVDKSFISSLSLVGICASDDVRLNSNILTLVYESSDANADIDGKLYNTTAPIYTIHASKISLIGKTKDNYKLTDAATEYYATAFTNIGVIKAKSLKVQGIKAFDKTFDDTKEVRVDVAGIIYIGRLEGDVASILTENLKFELADKSVGVGREVAVDYSQAITGADSRNYSVSFEKIYIDIYPRELEYNIAGYGTIKVVDRDGLCKIPFGAELRANIYEKGSEEYSNAYVRVENEIQKDEKFKQCLNVYIVIDGVQQAISSGLYVYLPKVDKLEQIIQFVNTNKITTLESNTQEDYTIIKVEQGQAKFAVLVSRTYIPLWLIILIASSSVLVIGVFAGIIIVIRQKSKNKYNKYNKI